MSRKHKIGDVVWWRKQRRVIQRITPTQHGGHCYYGLRMLKTVARKLPTVYPNVGFDGRADKTRIYWVRSDRLDGYDGTADRKGKSGRPELMAYKGRRKTSRQNNCPHCHRLKYKESRSCKFCRWRYNPSRVCACGERKDRRSVRCQSCHAKASMLLLSAQTESIVIALKRDQKYGSHSRVAREFGLSRARVSAIAKRHLTRRSSSSAPCKK